MAERAAVVGGQARLRLDLAYDGSGFSGWARQPGRRTVQDVVEVALGRLLHLDAPPALTVAGRTDAGVHARGQVAHADVPTARWASVAPAVGCVSGQESTVGCVSGQESTVGCVSGRESAALRSLAGLLAPDVRVRSVGVAPRGFDARFSALWRRYSYRVCDDPAAADPLRRADTLWHRRRLDTGRMNEAARACLGEHDFAAYCRRGEGASTVRRLIRLDWMRRDGVVVADVVADAFCHNMVRALVGALLAVGDGRGQVTWPRDVLAAGVRDPAVHVAPPHGLCLEEVGYPADAGLARRAEATRRHRGPAKNLPGA
jgi:tRNA pseudouridine38-40 synthase